MYVVPHVRNLKGIDGTGPMAVSRSHTLIASLLQQHLQRRFQHQLQPQLSDTTAVLPLILTCFTLQLFAVYTFEGRLSDR